MTRSECLLAAARYIATDGASLERSEADQVAAMLTRLVDDDAPQRFLEVMERHARTVSLTLLLDLAAALNFRLTVVRLPLEKEPTEPNE